jgi:cyclopropane fatty-acyl-phospholipid synthase-like methyltransferase
MTAEYFNQWFADIARSDTRERLFSEGLGVPLEVGPSNLVPLDGLHAVASALRLEPGGLLIDLACGRGGPGMWVARECEAELIGIDFSAEAVVQASARRALFGLGSSATFAVGELESTGLSAGSADAVMCIDAFQFAHDGVQAAHEIRRVLRSGGRVALTCWEPVDRDDDSLSERLRVVDLQDSLEQAGFTEIDRTERPDWEVPARALWETAVDMDPGDDPALQSTHDEAKRTLATWDRKVRVMATATAP